MYNFYIKDFDEEAQSFFLDESRTVYYRQNPFSGDLYYKINYNNEVKLIYTKINIIGDKIADTLVFSGAYFKSTGLLLNADSCCSRLLSCEKRNGLEYSNVLGDIVGEIYKKITLRINDRISKITTEEAVMLGGPVDYDYRKYHAKKTAERMFLYNGSFKPVTTNGISYNFDTVFYIDYILNPETKVEEAFNDIWERNKSNYAAMYLKNELCKEHYQDIVSYVKEGDSLCIRRAIINSIPTDAKKVTVNILKEGQQLSIKMQGRMLCIDEPHYCSYNMSRQDCIEFESRFGRGAHLMPDEITTIEFRNKILYEKTKS